MLECEVYRGVQACVFLCPLWLAQGVYVFLSFEEGDPIGRKIRSDISINLDLGGYGPLPHIHEFHGCLS